jgi:imidazolonepropionase-like amidohydrolase
MARNQTNSAVIRAARLIDGTGAAPVRDAALWLNAGKVAYAGPASGLPAQAATAPQLDLVDPAGATILPGLVDAHVHLVASAGPDLKAEVVGASSAALTIAAVANARRHLAAGTTLVRDLGATSDEAIALGRAVAAGTVAGPRVVAAGRAVTMTGGHIHYLGRVADGAEDMRLAVRENLALGATCIKVVATGGVLTPGIDPRRPAYDLDELEALVGEAHRHGLTVAAHAIGLDGVAAAVRAGVDSIEHGMFLDDITIELLASSSARLVPTFSAVRGILDGDAPEWIKARARPSAEAQAESFAKAVAAGVRIAAGTDAGTPGNHHGNVAGELAFMVAAGLDPLRAVTAATGDAADLLGAADRGRLVEGSAADVLVVDGDPLEDIGALRRVSHVFQDGREVGS